jgi:dipeptidyl aminopeptidase/acylaminoacyl peptidase
VFTDEPQFAMFVPALGLNPNASRNELEARASQLSPITYVNAKHPPTLIIQGDSDKIVPLQQAQAMDRALANAGVEHDLEVIPGGGHDETTFGPGLIKALQWFKANLLK